MTIRPDRLFHVSEEATIERFEPRLAQVVSHDEPLVWTLDGVHLPTYWFPRDCPRAAVWANTDDESAVLTSSFETSADRLHIVEESWMQRIRDANVFVYEFSDEGFEPFDDIDGCWVSRAAVRPIAVRPLGDLLELHQLAEIDLRPVGDIWPWVDRIVASGLPFSVVRSRNAQPRSPQ